MPRWVSVHRDQLPLHPGTVRIRIGLLILTAAAYAVTYLSAQRGKRSVWPYLLFGLYSRHAGECTLAPCSSNDNFQAIYARRGECGFD